MIDTLGAQKRTGDNGTMEGGLPLVLLILLFVLEKSILLFPSCHKLGYLGTHSEMAFRVDDIYESITLGWTPEEGKGRKSWEKLSGGAGQAAPADPVGSLGAKTAKCWAFIPPPPSVIGCGPSICD